MNLSKTTLILAGLLVSVTGESNNTENPGSVCVTPECAVAAARVSSSLDHSVRPCDNFYQYACGTWMKNNPLVGYFTILNNHQIGFEKLEIAVKGLLEEETVDGEIEAVRKAKDFYKSCVDEDTIETRGIEPLQFLYAAVGKWPLLLNDWNESDFDLIDTMVATTAYGQNPLIYQGVSKDPKNKTVQILELNLPYVILPSHLHQFWYRREEALPVLKTFIVSLAKAFGAENMGRVDEDVNAILEFETALANLTLPWGTRWQRHMQPHNRMTINELSVNLNSGFDWMRLIGGLMNLPGVGIPITGDEEVLVYSLVRLRNVVALIEKTPKRVLINYMLTVLILDTVPSLPQEIRDLEKTYMNGLYSRTNQSPRPDMCYRLVYRNLGNAVGRLYVDKYFDEDAKATALEMIETLKSAFYGILDDVDWMDNATIAAAKDKVKAMGSNIGYSEKHIKNDTHLNEEYKDLLINKSKYFENFLINKKLWTIKALKKLGSVDTPVLPRLAADVYYASNRGINSMTFPAGKIQPPYFSKNYPVSMNFGGIGMYFGRYITGAVDEKGRLYDNDGNTKTWWDGPVLEKFNAKAQCITEQYSNISVAGIDFEVNLDRTRRKSIADNGGLKMSFAAYRKWVKDHGTVEQMLPGLSFNHNQLFFLNYAQVWCETLHRTGPGYSSSSFIPRAYRVLGVLQNSPEFSEAFNCTKGSYMNPERKCGVW